MFYRTLATSVALTFIFFKMSAQDFDNVKELKLKPLNVLIEAGLQNSHEIKANLIDAARQTLTWQVQKRSWTDVLFVSGQAIYGGGSVLDATSNGAVTNYLLNDRKNLNLNMTMGFRVTAGDIFNRSNKAQIQHIQLERLGEEKRQIEYLIKEQIITSYSNLELALKIIKLKADGLENHHLALSIAEKFFKEGNYPPSEYATLLAKVTSAAEQFEQAKAEAKKLSLLLKNLVNLPIYEK